MRSRPSSRLLILNAQGRVLLFRFVHVEGPLAGQDYWATPGGGVEAGETYQQAACRELMEETGLHADDPGPVVAEREFVLQMPDGENVLAQEKFFVIRTSVTQLSDQLWSKQEKQVIAAHHWWLPQELTSAATRFFPENLPSILASIQD